MKTENKIGEITFDNIIQLKELLKQAWLNGKVEQAYESLEKEAASYQRLAKKLGLKELKKNNGMDRPHTFETWFLDFVKDLITVI